ncbi:MAG: hypothetical protein HY064_02305 [Bacteroidetes bacterium]|nr:hypothetical protein [Bacteroidota bacterium]
MKKTKKGRKLAKILAAFFLVGNFIHFLIAFNWRPIPYAPNFGPGAGYMILSFFELLLLLLVAIIWRILNRRVQKD